MEDKMKHLLVLILTSLFLLVGTASADMSYYKLGESSSTSIPPESGDKGVIVYSAPPIIDENDEFYKGFGFSDQCYLIKTKDFKKCIYNKI